MTLEQRLSRLESRNFRLQLALGLMTVMLAFLALAAAQSKPADTLRISRLEVTDAQGVVRAVLIADQLALLNSEGKSQVSLKVINPDGKDSAGKIAVANHDGQQIVSLEQGNDGAGTIVSRRRDGKENVVIGGHSTGGIITVKDDSDRLGCAIGFVPPESSPRCVLLQPGSQSSVELSASANASSVKLRDVDGKLRIEFDAKKDLTTASLFNPEETPCISLMNARGEGNHIFVLRENGKKWIVPPQ